MYINPCREANPVVQVQSQGVPGRPKAKPPMVFGSPDSTDSNLTRNIGSGNDQFNQLIKPTGGTISLTVGSKGSGGGASNRRGNRIIDGVTPGTHGKDTGVRGTESNIPFVYRISYNLYG